jgi:hypothetical protein
MAGRITSETGIAASRSLCNFAAFQNPDSFVPDMPAFPDITAIENPF